MYNRIRTKQRAETIEKFVKQVCNLLKVIFNENNCKSSNTELVKHRVMKKIIESTGKQYYNQRYLVLLGFKYFF